VTANRASSRIRGLRSVGGCGGRWWGAGTRRTFPVPHCPHLEVLIFRRSVVVPRISSTHLGVFADRTGWPSSLRRVARIPRQLQRIGSGRMCLVLPSHNEPFRGLHRRLEVLIEGHEEPPRPRQHGYGGAHCARESMCCCALVSSARGPGHAGHGDRLSIVITSIASKIVQALHRRSRIPRAVTWYEESESAQAANNAHLRRPQSVILPVARSHAHHWFARRWLQRGRSHVR